MLLGAYFKVGLARGETGGFCSKGIGIEEEFSGGEQVMIL
jgi:hypothetical protein